MIDQQIKVKIVRVFAWCSFVLLTGLSLMPMPELVGKNINDLFLHFIAYGGVMWSFTQGYPETRILKLMSGLIVWGILLEMMQGLTSYRLFEWMDMVANSTGVVLGWVLSRCHKPVLEMIQTKSAN